MSSPNGSIFNVRVFSSNECPNAMFIRHTGVTADVLEWQVTASFIQIYKEHLSDLLEPRSKNLQIRTDFQTDTPYVQGLRTVSVNGLGDVLKYLMNAFSNRIVASHKLNSESSRSHMLLTLNVEQKVIPL